MKIRRTHLREARQRLGLSALALGEQTGIREERVFAVERGRYRPRRDEAARWAGALKMSRRIAFPELFGGDAGKNTAVKEVNHGI